MGRRGRRRASPGGETRAGVAGFLRRHPFEVGAVALLALLAAFLYAWPSLNGSSTALADGKAPVAGGRAALPTIVPATRPPLAGPTAVPAYQPPLLTESDAINVVSSRPVNGTPLTSLRQVKATWSAEYRGDGTWLVRGDDASWLLFEQTRATLPANLAAVNLETRNREYSR